MPLPANFSNFGKSGNTAALNSRNDNFASFTPPPRPAPAPAPAPAPVPSPIPTPTPPPATPTDFSGNPKDIPPDGDCEVICDSDGENCYCPTGEAGTSAGDGTATQDDIDNAIEGGKMEVDDIVEISQDAAKYLQMAEAGTSLLRVANAALNGMGLEVEANSVTTQANQLQIDRMRLEANVNSGLNTLNQGINNRNIGQIQSGFNKLEAAKIEASQLQTRGQDVVRQAQALESRVQKFQATDTGLQMIGQGLGYGAQVSMIAGQSYQAFNQPTPENIGAVGATTAQTGLRLLSEATSFVSPLGAQIGSGLIGAGQEMSVQASRGGSPTDVALGFVNIVGASAYGNVKEGVAALNAGQTARGAGKITNAALDVVQIGAAATGFGGGAAMVVIPTLRGFTEFGVELSQGADIGTAALGGANAGLASSFVGKTLGLVNIMSQAQQGQEFWFNAAQPATGALRTFDAPLTSTKLVRDPSTGKMTYVYQPSLYNQYRSQGALVQQIQTEGATFDQTSLAIASAKQAAIRAKYGIDAVNFSAKE